MAKITDEIISKARMEVIHYIEENLAPEYVYHNAYHTHDVCHNAQKIGKESGLSSDDMRCLLLAAIFHDSGYVHRIAGHEIVSAQKAGEFLEREGIDNDQAEKVKQAIIATKVPQNPRDQISRVLCDADLMHLGSKDYFEQMELLRKEWKLTGRADLSEKEFHIQSVPFFKEHHFHTRYAKEVLGPQKVRNLDLIRAKIS